MNKQQAENWTHVQSRLMDLGINREDIETLFGIERTLQRWSELECGNSNNYASYSVERDEVTERPFMVTHPHDGSKTRRYAVADRERGAIKRLAAIMRKYPFLWYYHQGDPRGCALYIGRYVDLPSGTNLSKPEAAIDSYHNRGVAVCY